MKSLNDRIDGLLIEREDVKRIVLYAASGPYSDMEHKYATESNTTYTVSQEQECARAFQAAVNSGHYHTVTVWFYSSEDDSVPSSFYGELDAWTNLPCEVIE